MSELLDWPNNGIEFNKWYHDLTRFITILNDAPKGWWVCDIALKYLDIRIDTRNNGFILLVSDTDGSKFRISPNMVIDAINKWEGNA